MKKKIFLDCGFHHGEGLAQFERILRINNEWIVHCFEPNLRALCKSDYWIVTILVRMED